MISSTHILVAKKVCKIVEENLDIKINRRWFLYGSIKPDITTKKCPAEHYKEKGEYFVISEINDISQNGIIEGKVLSKELSMRLGVLCHYLSDFFCKAHSKEFNNRSVKHVVYEMLLTLAVKKHKRGSTTCIPYAKSDEIYDYINVLHARYTALENCFSKDIDYSIISSTFTIISIINSITMKNDTEYFNINYNFNIWIPKNSRFVFLLFKA